MFVPGEGNGNPLQYSCLENSMDRGVRGPGGLQSVGHKESDMTEWLTHTFMFVLDLNMKYIPFFLSFHKEVQEALV